MNGEVGIEQLSQLLQVEVDAATAYGEAAREVPPGALRDELALFQVEHQRRALGLHDLFLRLGHAPPEVTPDVKGAVIGALTPPRRHPSPAEVLEAVRGNEQLLGSLYAKTLARGLPAPVQAVVMQARAEDRRHLDWIERTLSRMGGRSAASP